jgi:Zn finger protein HypA/HybF involved in hydrogenase expression
MHDIAVAASIVEKLKGYAGVKTVFVLLGRDSCVSAEMLKHSFGEARRGTPAEKAELVVVPGPGDEITLLSVELEDAGRGKA